jgi:hypothetical protein
MRHVAVVLVLAACGGASPPSPSPPPLPPAAGMWQFLAGTCPTCCPDWGCGTNGAWLGQKVVFHELDGSGLKANRAGLKVESFRDGNGNPMTIAVDRDNLRGIRPGGAAVEGASLIGATIELRTVAPPTGTVVLPERRYKLTIKAFETTDYWVDPDRPVPVYGFSFVPIGASDKPQDLCRSPAEGGSRWEPIKGMALIFSGDRYHEKAKTVTETGGGDPWFNIACAGTTVAKMHLLRHTWASNTDGAHATLPAQRQALLKLLVADYCGGGKPFTVDGHALAYSYDQAWEPSVDWSSIATIDAVWDEQRAVCLNVPRLRDKFGNIRNAIVTQCAAAGYTLKSCGAGLKPAVQGAASGVHPWSGYALSANP